MHSVHHFDGSFVGERRLLAIRQSPPLHEAKDRGDHNLRVQRDSDSRRSEGRTAAAEGHDLILRNRDLARRYGEMPEGDGPDVIKRNGPADAAEVHPAFVAAGLGGRPLHVEEQSSIAISASLPICMVTCMSSDDIARLDADAPTGSIQRHGECQDGTGEPHLYRLIFRRERVLSNKCQRRLLIRIKHS
ncbi:hypothetical protein [Bradyrhizobium sp. 141]|uniref:hypothetical protein n=1 Tax=Bradyrhizobium sp. 141 TaxID=2782617 RepID=UPI003207B292|nr:hypothetical protein [Bradyrhizobium sp. 141]